MTVTLNPILQRLAERRPLLVMARGILERCLNPAPLDAWFGLVAEQQYTRTLWFSAGFDWMTQVVLRQPPSGNAAWPTSRRVSSRSKRSWSCSRTTPIA